MKLLISFLLGVVVAIAVPLVVLAAGWINFGASQAAGPVESALAPWAYNQSIERHAPETANPFADDESALAAGRSEFLEYCVHCHGAPGVSRGEFAGGLNPLPPSLVREAVQERSDGELFWIVKHGIRMTGMPAFGRDHSDEELWKVVAYVRRLPSLSAAEREALAEAAGGSEGGHGHAH